MCECVCVCVCGAGLVTSCGCLGVVSKLTLQLVPLYDVDEVHYNGGSIASFIQNFRKLLTSCDR
eukprot:COSAG05_NODE_1301_length_5243_cov_2.688375_2_plen_64_part_00